MADAVCLPCPSCPICKNAARGHRPAGGGRGWLAQEQCGCLSSTFRSDCELRGRLRGAGEGGKRDSDASCNGSKQQAQGGALRPKPDCNRPRFREMSPCRHFRMPPDLERAWTVSPLRSASLSHPLEQEPTLLRQECYSPRTVAFCLTFLVKDDGNAKPKEGVRLPAGLIVYSGHSCLHGVYRVVDGSCGDGNA